MAQQTYNYPKDKNGQIVKIGDKVRGFGSIRFQDGFEIDRTPIVTANLQNGILYFGNLSAKSFTDGFEILKTNNMAQQTAVEWLFIQLYEKFEMKGDGMEMDKVLEQANQMFEEQIEKAWWAGHDERDSNHMIYPSEDCNQYYNATYGE